MVLPYILDIPTAGLLEGLVAYWPLADKTAVDLRSGIFRTAPLDLTNNAGVTRGVGPTNNLPNAASFDAGSSQYLSIADNAVLSITGNLQIIAWARTATKNVNRNVIGKWNGGAGQRSYQLAYLTATDRFAFFTSSTGANSASVSDAVLGNVSVDTWYFLSVQHDLAAGKLRIRTDTRAYTEAAAPGVGIFDGSAAFQISGITGGNYWNGLIGPVAIWDRLLTRSEEEQIYNGGQGIDLMRGI